MIAAVPVSVLAAGGSGVPSTSGPELAAAAVPSETNTTTGIGRSLCRIVGTEACSDSSSSTGTGRGTATDTATDTGTGTDTGATTDAGTATGTAHSTASDGPPGLCTNVRVPGCHTTTSSPRSPTRCST
ncbi:MAG TPA: hypothetical protein VF112_06235, partial [Candidatus Dormibacteraeota bacterium]